MRIRVYWRCRRVSKSTVRKQTGDEQNEESISCVPEPVRRAEHLGLSGSRSHGASLTGSGHAHFISALNRTANARVRVVKSCASAEESRRSSPKAERCELLARRASSVCRIASSRHAKVWKKARS